ncbi:hypothetical protein [Sciscionella sediminilitoris]|uniref:hypothetical protein n=1 Tax=Sciscionella sediminilitoris TaxID=1445613 RepID=UPI0004DF7E71|nr:hypothetical protein [Sciscionella sp. SE31]
MDQVWYASYGSNMSAARFGCYLYGGTPIGGTRRHPGCRDTRAPADDQALELPGGVYFAGESRNWTGGVAYYDPELTGTAYARAYLVTGEQFADVAAQETGREPGAEIDVAAVVRDGRLSLGPGGYETLLCLGERDGHPIVTFTAPYPAAAVEHTVPAAAYLRTLAEGLVQSREWTPEKAATYLVELSGVRGNWTAAEVTALLPAATG